MGTQLPFPKGAQPPPQFFDPCPLSQTARWTKVPLGTDGDPASPKKGGTALHPIFGPCLLWPNGWMDEAPLGTEVDLGPGHVVLDGD